MAIYVPIVMRLFFVVLQELQTCNFPTPWSLWMSISTQSFVSQLSLVIEIRWSKLKKKKKQQQGEMELLQFILMTFPLSDFGHF